MNSQNWRVLSFPVNISSRTILQDHRYYSYSNNFFINLFSKKKLNVKDMSRFESSEFVQKSFEGFQVVEFGKNELLSIQM